MLYLIRMWSKFTWVSSILDNSAVSNGIFVTTRHGNESTSQAWARNLSNQVMSQGGELGSPPGGPGSKSGIFCELDFCIHFQMTSGPKMGFFWCAVGPKISCKRCPLLQTVFLFLLISCSHHFQTDIGGKFNMCLMVLGQCFAPVLQRLKSSKVL